MDITELNAELLGPLAPPRAVDAHKGSFGHVLVVAGARGFMGACKLACEGAARSGVGLVTACVPYPLADVAAVMMTECMTQRLPATESESFAHEALSEALTLAADKSAVVLGPGVSRDPNTAAFVIDFVTDCPAPLVVDADGLNALSERPGALADRRGATVLTPHPGEMARLLGTSTAVIQADRAGAARRLAETSGCIVVLKGAGTLVASPDGALARNATGNHGMATGGTGDVLAGLLGGLLAQGAPAADAARLGVWLHGRAGDIAAARMGARAMIASDLLDELGAAWRELESA